MTNTELFDLWRARAVEDPDLLTELDGIRGDADAINDRFYRDLAFGTGGLRGVIGAGSNRMNIYTIRRATQGLADYINAAGLPKKVAIGHDSRHKGELVYPVGTPAFLGELESYGVPLGDSEEVGVVCVGFDTTLTYEKLDKAVHYLRRGAAFVAANPDWVCPMPANEVLPDCGSICALLTAASGVEPVFIGKPNRNMVDIISEQTGVPNENICCVGDRLYTDIAVAQNAGAVSVCVLSGESSLEDIEKAERKPDYVLKNVAEIADILKAHM